MIGHHNNNVMMMKHDEDNDEAAMAFTGCEHKNCDMQVYLSIG